jgi:lysophospholipase L1-like esterase
MLDRRKKLFLSLATIFIGILAALGVLSLGELITRFSTNIIFLGNSSNLFSPARYAGSRGNTPNSRAISFGETVYIDKMGFRVPSADYQYPSNEVYRVVILGDSIAFGPGVPEQKTFVGLLRSAKPDWAIFNTAVIGYDLNDYLNVSKTLLKTQRYQLAVLVLCLNDVSWVSAKLLDAPKISHEATTNTLQNNATAIAQAHTNKDLAPSTIVEQLRSLSIISTANDWLRTHSKLYLYLKDITSDPPARYFLADYKEYEDNIDAKLDPLLKIANEFRNADIPLLIVISPYEYQLRGQDQGDSALQQGADVMLPQKKIKAFLSSHGISALDPADFLRSQVAGGADSLFLPYDPMHFSERGHSLMLKYLERHINMAEPPSFPEHS